MEITRGSETADVHTAAAASPHRRALTVSERFTRNYLWNNITAGHIQTSFRIYSERAWTQNIVLYMRNI